MIYKKTVYTIVIIIFSIALLYWGNLKFLNQNDKIEKGNNLSNELLVTDRLPDFKKIKPEDFAPAMNIRLKEAREVIELAVNEKQPNWSNSIWKIEVSLSKLSEIVAVMHMLDTLSHDKYHTAYEKLLPEISKFGSEFIQNVGVYNLYKKIRQSDEFNTKLTKAQRKGVEDAIRDFELEGVNLSADKKAKLTKISQELVELSSKFSNNVMLDSRAWTYYLDDMDAHKIAKVPQNIKDAAQYNAREKGKVGFIFMLDEPTYSAIMKYSDDSKIREEFYKAYSTRASENWVLPEKHNNTPIIADILSKRALLAETLGMKNYAEYATKSRMINNTADVMAFLDNLNNLSHTKAEKEYEEFQEFVKVKYGIDKLEPWDIPYYRTLFEKEKVGLDDEELREYFELERVLNGLFFVANKLFGVKITEVPKGEFSSWNEDVRLYNVYSEDGQLKGQFYADLYVRSDKQKGAYTGSYRGLMKCYDESGATSSDAVSSIDGASSSCTRLPVAFLATNFSKPVGEKPSLLLYKDVIVLFHEFGHTMHKLLTKVDDMPSLSGSSGVEWDAIELPSKLMENWVIQEPVIAKIAQHFKTKEPLSNDLYQKIKDKENFQKALWLNMLLVPAFYDFSMHMENTVEKPIDQEKLLLQIRDKIGVIPAPDWVKMQNTFLHIFSGGYAAGYYSYLWSEVLSSDVFAAFEEAGIFDHDTGRSFLREILEKGGSEKTSDMFVSFRGRPPEVKYLLKSYGLY